MVSRALAAPLRLLIPPERKSLFTVDALCTLVIDHQALLCFSMMCNLGLPKHFLSPASSRILRRRASSSPCFDLYR